VSDESELENRSTTSRMFKKLFEAGVLAVIEETARQLFPDFLAFAWMVILCALTWELLNHAKVKPYTLKLYRTVGVNHRMFSYIFAAVTGAVLLVGYWWTIEKIFTKPPKKVAAAPKENPAAIPIAQQ